MLTIIKTWGQSLFLFAKGMYLKSKIQLTILIKGTGFSKRNHRNTYIVAHSFHRSSIHIIDL